MHHQLWNKGAYFLCWNTENHRTVIDWKWMLTFSWVYFSTKMRQKPSQQRVSPRWGLAYELGIPSPSKSSLKVRFCLYSQEEEENADPWQYKEKRNEDNHNILSICIYYIAGHCLSLTWVWYNKLPFGCSRKGRAKVKGCSCVCTTDITF